MLNVDLESHRRRIGSDSAGFAATGFAGVAVTDEDRELLEV